MNRSVRGLRTLRGGNSPDLELGSTQTMIINAKTTQSNSTWGNPRARHRRRKEEAETTGPDQARLPAPSTLHVNISTSPYVDNFDTSQPRCRASYRGTRSVSSSISSPEPSPPTTTERSRNSSNFSLKTRMEIWLRVGWLGESRLLDLSGEYQLELTGVLLFYLSL